jgi:hypothetical protein
VELILTLLEKSFGWLYCRLWLWRELRVFYERAVKEAKGIEALKQTALEVVHSKANYLAKAQNSTEDVYTRLADLMEGHKTWDKRGEGVWAC